MYVEGEMLNVPIPIYQHNRVNPIEFPRIIEDERESYEEKKPVYLERQLTTVSAVNYILNSVIGTGIFISPGTILAECGSIGMSFTMWSLCAIISLLTVLPFAELCSVVPQCGSQYIYIQEAFRDFHPFYGQMPGFLYIWINYFILRPALIAIYSLLVADYMYPFITTAVTAEFDIYYNLWIKKFIGSLLLCFIGVINCQSVKVYVISQDLMSYFKMVLCLGLILSGAYMYLSEQAIAFDLGFDNTTMTITHLTLALYSGLYAYDGGSTITCLSEEIKNPERTVLPSLIIGLGMVTTTYLLLNLTFLSALTVSEITASPTVAKTFVEKLFGVEASFIVSISVSISTIGSNLSNIFYSSRLAYAAAKEGHMMKFLSYIHRTRFTPTPAVILQVALAVVFCNIGKNTETLISLSSFVLWLYYGFTMVALIILRVKKPNAWRPYKVPLVIPGTVLVISWLLVATSLVTQSFTTFIATVIIVGAGITVQFFFIYKKKQIKGLNKVTTLLQRWLDVVPPS